MAEYVFPAVFHKNEDHSYTISYPDLPGCISEGKDLGNALHMAQDALSQWIEYLTDKQADIPAASAIDAVELEKDEFSSYIRADVRYNRAVRRTVSLPKWMDEKAASAGLSLSRVLQDSLSERLQA